MPDCLSGKHMFMYGRKDLSVASLPVCAPGELPNQELNYFEGPPGEKRNPLTPHEVMWVHLTPVGLHLRPDYFRGSQASDGMPS